MIVENLYVLCIWLIIPKAQDIQIHETGLCPQSIKFSFLGCDKCRWPSHCQGTELWYWSGGASTVVGAAQFRWPRKRSRIQRTAATVTQSGTITARLVEKKNIVPGFSEIFLHQRQTIKCYFASSLFIPWHHMLHVILNAHGSHPVRSAGNNSIRVD